VTQILVCGQGVTLAVHPVCLDETSGGERRRRD
jgi:hypothetical protein